MWYRLLCAMAVCLAMTPIIPGDLSGDEKNEANLSFAMPEGVTLHYKTSWSAEYNYMGVSVVQNQSYGVDLKLVTVTEEGDFHVSLDFSETSSSMVVDDDIQEWTPPLQLEGKSITVDVGSNGEVLKVKPVGNIPGMRSMKDLENISNIWFIELPDTVKKVGESWRKEIEDYGEMVEGEEKGEPMLKGWADLTFKKIEKKMNIPVACIEVKTKLEIHQETPKGVMNGSGEGEGKYYLAIDGGYIVEMNSDFEIKGTVVSPGGEETETAVTQYYEAKLKK